MASPAKRRPTVAVGGKIDIHESAGGGCLVDVKAYLKAGGLIDKRDADRWTPLMLAVREGHLEVAKLLLRSGATLEARDSDKWTALHVAAANGHPQCCQLLLDRGANPRAVDENKRTPLHWATRCEPGDKGTASYKYSYVPNTIFPTGCTSTGTAGVLHTHNDQYECSSLWSTS